MESFKIAKEPSSSLSAGGVWSIYIWSDDDEAWYSEVEFVPEGQAGIVAFVPLGPFETAEIALLEGETEFHRTHYRDEMTLLFYSIPVQCSPDGYDLPLTSSGEIKLKKVEGFQGREIEPYNMNGIIALSE
jgi:hypothetical protein